MGALIVASVFPLLVISLVDSIKIIPAPNLGSSKSFVQYYGSQPVPFFISTNLDHTNQHSASKVLVNNDNIYNKQFYQPIVKTPINYGNSYLATTPKRAFVENYYKNEPINEALPYNEANPTTNVVHYDINDNTENYNSAEDNYEPEGRYGRYDPPQEEIPERTEINSIYNHYEPPQHMDYHVEIPKSKKEVHYHQHKHVHEHNHDQKHAHQHLGGHMHNHGHVHKSQNKHQHQHHSSHHHSHKSGHKHHHMGGHSHSHHDDHKHEHKSSHHHGHHHSAKHEHHQEDKHHHSHHSQHKHKHQQESKHDHKHGHNHHGSHKHDHHSKHEHGHKHEHKHGHKHSKH